MLEICNLTKYYGPIQALTDVNLTLESNKILGLLGPNGAGKTTLMNIITGYLSPTAGTVKIAGFDLLDEPFECRKQIGYLPEQPPLYNEMTIVEYLQFVASLKLSDTALYKEAIDKVLVQLHLTEVKERLIGNLSRGFRQRLGIAQALIGEPKILILDEPTTGLDPVQMDELHSTIRSLKKKHTIIFSSHILSEVAELCDQVAILSDGRLHTSGFDSDDPENVSRYRIVTDAPLKQVSTALRKIPGILNTDPIEGRNDALEIRTDGKQDIRSRVFFMMSDNRWPLLEFRPTTDVLNERFRSIIKGTGAKR